MNQTLANLVVCPTCRKTPRLTVFEKDHGERSHLTGGEVAVGALACERCSVVYPIISGVPRFLDGGIRNFPEFVSRYRTELNGNKSLHENSVASPLNQEDDYEAIRRSFSHEWSIFDYEKDKTWGWTVEERKKIFLQDVRLSPEQLRNKRMLDAGCGNGTMTAALGDFDLNIVGLDLNDGLDRAYANRARYSEKAAERVQYVQGNLVSPPFQRESFDLIYSSGVIHHTPSSKKTFDSLVGLVRPGGRLYVWVYRRRAWPVQLFFGIGRGLKRWLSLRAIMRICQLLAPFYQLAATVINKITPMKFRSRSNREITLDLFDAFAPRYNHWHSPSEVRSWFEGHGFKNIQLSTVQKHGFGMYADKP